MHPGFNSAPTVEFCQKHGIVFEAWGPLGNGRVLNNQHKSSKEERIIENAKVFDFELDGTDMSIIGNMPPCGGFCVDADNAPEDE